MKNPLHFPRNEEVGNKSRFLERAKGTLECAACGTQYRDFGEIYITPRCPRCGKSIYFEVSEGKRKS